MLGAIVRDGGMTIGLQLVPSPDGVHTTHHTLFIMCVCVCVCVCVCLSVCLSVCLE